MSSNSDKRFGLVDKTDGVGEEYMSRQTVRSLGEAAIRIKFGTPFLDQSIVRSTFFLRTVTS